jgi:hypothetical protein
VLTVLYIYIAHALPAILVVAALAAVFVFFIGRR